MEGDKGKLGTDEKDSMLDLELGKRVKRSGPAVRELGGSSRIHGTQQAGTGWAPTSLLWPGCPGIAVRGGREIIPVTLSTSYGYIGQHTG